MRREYPADLWLTYRAIKYRPAQLQAFVARGDGGRATSRKGVGGS